MSRRKSEEGHFGLYKRDNNFWYYYVYDKDGIRHQYSTGKKVKARAQDYVSQLLMHGDIVRNCPKAKHRLNVFAKDFYDYDNGAFIRDRLARGFHYSVKLAKTNQSALERHIFPYFGDKLIQNIKASEIDAWLLDLPENADISNKTANTALSLFRQVLDEAEKAGIIDSNPARKVDPLAKKDDSTRRRAAFTTKQIKQLFSENWPNRQAQVACMLSAATGMRLGEIRALQRSQIHEDFIYVDASYSEYEGRKTTKSGWGRVVPLHPQLRALLLAVCCSDTYVFTYDGKTPLSASMVPRALTERMSKCGILPPPGQLLTFHSFRHYCNSRLVADGVAGDKIRAIIGHEAEAMTEHYAHLEASDFAEVQEMQLATLGL